MIMNTAQYNSEIKVLSMLMCGSDDARNKIFNVIDERYFSGENLKQIFLLTRSLFLTGEEYNFPVGKEKLFFDLVIEIQSGYITDANWEFYANILINNYENSLLEKTKESIQNAKSFEELTGHLEQQKKLIAKKGIKTVEVNDALLNDFFSDYYKGFESLKTGYDLLDDTINGFYPGEYITLAGATGMGKTAVALNLLLNFAEQGKRCLFISLEMKALALINRMVVNKAGIRGDKIRGRKLTSDEEERYADTFKNIIKPLPFVVIDESRMTIDDIRLQAMKHKKDKGLDVLIIDYLGLISSKTPNQNLYQKTTELTRDIKILAKELNVPIICLCQLSRANSSRPDNRPKLSDLRDSGSIEQDSDIVLFCNRPEYYDKNSTQKGVIELIVAKHREGEVKIVELCFQKEFQKITNKRRF